MAILRLFSYQLLILLINTSTGVLITRTSSFEVRANISAISAWLSFSLIILNQTHFEQILRKKNISNHRDWLVRTILFMSLSFIAIASLKLTYWIIPIAFLYMLINTLVQFRGAHVILSHGNSFYLRLNLFFYQLNLLQIILLVLFHRLNVATWLMASLVADILLLALYSSSLKSRKNTNPDSIQLSKVKFSSAAVAATLIDAGMIMIANKFASPRELSFLVVAISCISPMIIMYNVIQNRILTDPHAFLKQFSKINFFLMIPSFVVFSIAYYFSIFFGVAKIFGTNYSSLSGSSLTIIVMGYLLLIFKVCNTFLRALNFNSESLSLTFLLLSSFSILCAVVPKSDESLIWSAVLSLTLTLLLLGTSQLIRFFFFKGSFQQGSNTQL